MVVKPSSAIIQVLVLAIFLVLVHRLVNYNCRAPLMYVLESMLTYEDPQQFEFFDNEKGTPSGRYIVPNYVHFIRWGSSFSFIDAVCVLAAFKNQRPDKLFIHTDNKGFNSKYWDVVFNEPGLKEVLEFKYLEPPREIYGQELDTTWRLWHGGDIARIRILMEYGGIFLDNDSFVMRNLNDFRKFEMTLGWQDGALLMDQAIVAHKNARFLRKWLSSYRHNYRAWGWYDNIGVIPTYGILAKEPYLIHRMKILFNEDRKMSEFLYLENSVTWQDHYVIHLSARHTHQLKRNLTAEATYPVIFNETNILKYNATILQMVRSVYPL